MAKIMMSKLCLDLLFLKFVLLAAAEVPITYLENAVAKGAVCLDGSPPAYHFDEGSGLGVNNWMVYIEGGGWCKDIKQCTKRMKTQYGSSKYMNKYFGFSGMLGGEEKTNPDFYNWNRVKVRYCDGSSFTGNKDYVDPSNNLYFRGARIFRAVIDDLMEKGMKGAENAILAGCSAGGLATILHCDEFHSLLPETTKVKCFSDAGYFIHGRDISGGSYIESFYKEIVTTHGSENSLPSSCTSKMKPELCFFPQYVVQFMSTPLFVLNAAFDSWQIKNVLAPSPVDKYREWNDAKHDLDKCTAAQLQTVQGFRDQMLDALSPVLKDETRGVFLDTCYTHCQTAGWPTWCSNHGPKVHNTTISKAVGDWFNERNSFRQVDCPTYRCNPTCPAVSTVEILEKDEDQEEEKEDSLISCVTSSCRISLKSYL